MYKKKKRILDLKAWKHGPWDVVWERGRPINESGSERTTFAELNVFQLSS